jgi:hypothetical protein
MDNNARGVDKAKHGCRLLPQYRGRSAGMVARDDRGRVMLTTWRTLSSCASPEEAEAGPCLQGLRLIVQWIGRPAYVESDCSIL